MQFRIRENLQEISKDEVIEIIKNIPNFNKNSNVNVEQFTKLINDKVEWVGVFNKEHCTALAALRENTLKLHDIAINELQSFEKGAGQKLLQAIIDEFNCVWLLSRPGNDKLLDYYRQFNLKEYVLPAEKSIYNVNTHFFYKAFDDVKMTQAIRDWYKK